MERRALIRQMIISGTGVLFLPSCFRRKTINSIALKHLFVDTEQETVMVMISETIIPKTDTLGAKELGLHLFVLKMIDDCTDSKVQDAFMEGLKEFTRENRKFIDKTQDERVVILSNIDIDANASKNLKVFGRKMRQLTIRGFMNSKYVMTELLPYQMIPGHFYGCINKSQKSKMS